MNLIIDILYDFLQMIKYSISTCMFNKDILLLYSALMSLSALQIYYYPGHWIQCLPARNVSQVFFQLL